jgi:uncharacterized protein YndB with AHSA1/START domain
MASSGTLTVTTPTDREIAFSRVFNAPRELVFEAYTTPELVKQWLGVRAGWTFDVCEIDLRVGGAYRFVWRSEQGIEMGMGGVYRVVEPPVRLVATEKFDQSWYPGEAESTVTLDEKDGRTTLTLSVKYESKAARDGVLQSPAKEGLAEGFDNLARILAPRIRASR